MNSYIDQFKLPKYEGLTTAYQESSPQAPAPTDRTITRVASRKLGISLIYYSNFVLFLTNNFKAFYYNVLTK